MRAVTWVGRNLWITFLALAVGLVSPTLARELPGERESLAGLAGVAVVVEDVDVDVEREGLMRSTLQTDVEVKLRLAGIPVLTITELALAPGIPLLSLIVTTLRVPEVPLYAVEVLLQLRQEVRLARKPSIALSAATWKTSWIHVAGTKRLASVRETVRDLVDQFINDYLAANPKR